ncbi:phage minor head protein [Arthrobacter sp. M-10]|uniref:phage minor head protein n=1 Tax=Arthrobacter sp. M-10 TaxID=3233037 RepID=UPI003F93D5B6
MYEQQLLTALRQQFEKQRDEILGNASTKSLKAYGIGKVTKADKKDYLAALLVWAAYDAAMAAVIAPIIYALIVETGKTAISDLNLDPSMFNGTTAAVLAYYQDRSNKIATDVNAETEKQLRATLGQGIDNNESDDELQARIEVVMGAALTYRADRIARTEVARAQGFGDIQAWMQSGTVVGKEWYTVKDERVCFICNSLDGTIVALDANFFDKGDSVTISGSTITFSYDDVFTANAHVNCRCTLLDVDLPIGDVGSLGDEP